MNPDAPGPSPLPTDPVPSPDRARERELLAEACDRPSPAERSQFLDTACGADAALRRRLDDLMQLEAEAEAFFAEAPVLDAAAAPDAPSPTRSLGADELQELSGAVIGRYRLLEPLGEGGFGRVYRAEQLEPVRRLVALKILKPGLDSREVIARFETERQALALMDHPNIAKVLDAGTADFPHPPIGNPHSAIRNPQSAISNRESALRNPQSAIPPARPFFVMELVEGRPITEYCDAWRLTLHQRLDLFRPVCQAVQHAHQKGIIHRDLKPSNILVLTQDGHPLPKVIDFGIAKAIEPTPGTSAVTTLAGRLVGTPAYMSPEQALAGSRDVDTRSDIYSLGVVLYELLCGCPPHDPEQLQAQGLAGMHRFLIDHDPAPPSTRVRALGPAASDVADLRSTTPPQLTAGLRGELDWIVLKALERERDRRYVTANALANDLERCLREEPITAAPPSLGYRTRKFVRRHRHAVAAAAGIALALIVGLLLATIAFFQTRAQRNRAIAAERIVSAQALHTRRLAYASDLALAQHALERSNLGQTRHLLDRHRPGPVEPDLRGWEWYWLDQQCRSDAAFSLGQLSNAVSTLAVTPDGRHVVSAGMDGTAMLWDIAPPHAPHRLPGAGEVLALSPDGRTLACADPGGGVVLRPFDNPGVTTRLPVAEVLSSLAFSGDGTLLAGFASEGTLYFWPLPAGQPVAARGGFPATSRHGGDLIVSARGDWVLLGGSDGRVRQIETRSGNVLQSWPAHHEAVTALALAPDQQRVATAAGFSEREVHLWRLADAHLDRAFSGPQAWISSLAFSPDGARLAAASADQSLRIWDLTTPNPPLALRGHVHEVWSLAFLPDGQTLVSGGKDGTLNVWDLRTPRRTTAPLNAALRPGGFTTDSRHLLGLDLFGQVVRWEIDTDPSPNPVPWAGDIVLLATAPTAPAPGWIATADRAGVVEVHAAFDPPPRWRHPSATGRRPTALRFTANGHQLVTVYDGQGVEIRSSADGSLSATWDTPAGRLSAIALSPDGRWLASGGDRVRVLDLHSGRPITEFVAHSQPTDAVAFSPDGQYLATASQEGAARLWSAPAWHLAAETHGHQLGVHAVAFSPDGHRLATGSVGDEAVKLWDLATHQEVLNLTWPGQQVTDLAFSPDGHTLSAASANGELRLWRTTSISARPTARPSQPESR